MVGSSSNSYNNPSSFSSRCSRCSVFSRWGSLVGCNSNLGSSSRWDFKLDLNHRWGSSPPMGSRLCKPNRRLKHYDSRP